MTLINASNANLSNLIVTTSAIIKTLDVTELTLAGSNLITILDSSSGLLSNILSNLANWNSSNQPPINLSNIPNLNASNVTVNGSLTVHGPVYMQDDGPVRIKNLIVDNLVYARPRGCPYLSNAPGTWDQYWPTSNSTPCSNCPCCNSSNTSTNSNSYSNFGCCCHARPCLLPQLPVCCLIPSCSNTSVDQILGDLIVDGLINARMGFCSTGRFYDGLAVMGGMLVQGDSILDGKVYIKDLVVDNLTATRKLSNVDALPPPGSNGVPIDTIMGDLVVDGNVYIRGGASIEDERGLIHSMTIHALSNLTGSMQLTGPLALRGPLTLGLPLEPGLLAAGILQKDWKIQVLTSTPSNWSEVKITPPQPLIPGEPRAVSMSLRTDVDARTSDQSWVLCASRFSLASTPASNLVRPGAIVYATGSFEAATGEPLVELTDLDSDRRVFGVIEEVLDDSTRGGLLTTGPLATLVNFPAAPPGQQRVRVRCHGRCDVLVRPSPVTSPMVTNPTLTLSKGDLLTCASSSSNDGTPGIGRLLEEDVIRSFTVGKVLADVTFSGPDEVKLVPCSILL